MTEKYDRQKDRNDKKTGQVNRETCRQENRKTDRQIQTESDKLRDRQLNEKKDGADEQTNN